MYANAFGLADDPFKPDPGTGGYEQGRAFARARNAVAGAVHGGARVCVLAGPAGIGKSLILRSLAAVLRADGVDCALITCRRLQGAAELLSALPAPGTDAIEALLLDDAHLLEPEHLRALLRHATGRNIAAVIAGPPDLERWMAGLLPPMVRAGGLVAVQVGPLSAPEVADYVDHRLAASGRRHDALFSPAALAAVVTASGGIPRQVDRLCSISLLHAALAGRERIEPDVVAAAVAELDVSPRLVELSPAPDAITVPPAPPARAPAAATAPKPLAAPVRRRRRRRIRARSVAIACSVLALVAVALDGVVEWIAAPAGDARSVARQTSTVPALPLPLGSTLDPARPPVEPVVRGDARRAGHAAGPAAVAPPVELAKRTPRAPAPGDIDAENAPPRFVAAQMDDGALVAQPAPPASRPEPIVPTAAPTPALPAPVATPPSRKSVPIPLLKPPLPSSPAPADTGRKTATAPGFDVERIHKMLTAHRAPRGDKPSTPLPAAAIADPDGLRRKMAGLDDTPLPAAGDDRLEAAVRGGEVETVRALLRSGADPDQTDATGRPILLDAAGRGDRLSLAALIAGGARVNRADPSGATALMAAVRTGDADVVDLLLRSGADVNAQRRDGWSALMYATRGGHWPIVRRLIAAGANPVLANADGDTAASLARQSATSNMGR